MLIKENKLVVIGKILLGLVVATAFLYVGAAYAAQQNTAGIAGVASNIISNFKQLARLITAGAYIGGMGFAVGAILKFKAHKDNPTQIPIGTPIALIFIAAALIFMPSIFSVAGQTLFTAGVAGGYSGQATFST